MSVFSKNIKDNNIVTEAEMSYILSYFDYDYILGIVDYGLNNRFNNINILLDNNMNNIVRALEDTYNVMGNSMPFPEQIKDNRSKIYKQIIDMICKRNNIEFIYSDELDLYSVAYYVYDFFVASFFKHAITFFTKFILREYNSIYSSMNLFDQKKNKDSSTLYNKRIYKEVKLAIIDANVGTVLNNMATYDISLRNILELIYDKTTADFLLSVLRINQEGEYFVNNYIALVLNDYTKADLISSLRIELQKYGKYIGE